MICQTQCLFALFSREIFQMVQSTIAANITSSFNPHDVARVPMPATPYARPGQCCTSIPLLDALIVQRLQHPITYLTVRGHLALVLRAEINTVNADPTALPEDMEPIHMQCLVQAHQHFGLTLRRLELGTKLQRHFTGSKRIVASTCSQTASLLPRLRQTSTLFDNIVAIVARRVNAMKFEPTQHTRMVVRDRRACRWVLRKSKTGNTLRRFVA
jgi:hypothetical protein